MAMQPKPKFFVYLAVGYLIALVIEFGAASSGDSKLFQNTAWFLFFLLWYGFLLSMSYVIFKKRPLWLAAVTWMILGPIIELILFRRSFLFTDVFYFVIFVPPPWFTRRIK